MMTWEFVEKFEIILSLAMNFVEIAIVFWGVKNVNKFLNINTKNKG